MDTGLPAQPIIFIANHFDNTVFVVKSYISLSIMILLQHLRGDRDGYRHRLFATEG